MCTACSKDAHCVYALVLSGKLTTPRIPYKVKYVLTLVQVLMFRTGRMALMLKTGSKALSSTGWVGSEQFTSMAPERTGHTVKKNHTCRRSATDYWP